VDRHRNRPVHGRLEREFEMKSSTSIGARATAFAASPAQPGPRYRYGLDRYVRGLQIVASASARTRCVAAFRRNRPDHDF